VKANDASASTTATASAAVKTANDAIAELDIQSRPDTTVINVEELTRIFLGKQSQVLNNPIAQGVKEELFLTLIGNKTLVMEVADAKSIPLVLAALRHIVPFQKKEFVQDPLKDLFQPLRKCYSINRKKPPRDSDDEGDYDDDDGGDGGGGGGGRGYSPGCFGPPGGGGGG